ncbi:uncharacterized protein LOC116114338 [Pistacia vera]|uniref:uncharacterized protein LOC116114338 n=1 Tax=Pistacia vera TaxID=55513 RepID=UPI001262B9D3|nr:uncharacterized protein LOC116114338 [Pistacia vera]
MANADVDWNTVNAIITAYQKKKPIEDNLLSSTSTINCLLHLDNELRAIVRELCYGMNLNAAEAMLEQQLVGLGYDDKFRNNIQIQLEEQQQVQFFMALRDELEGLRGTILHCRPLSSIDSVVSELLAEEIRLKTQTQKGILPTPIPSVLAVPSRPSSNYQSKPNLKRTPTTTTPSSSGKLANQRPYKSSQPKTAVVVSSSDSFGFGITPSPNSSIAAFAEQFQKFLATQPHAMSAASPTGLSSSSGMPSTMWVLDSGASHHMSPDPSSFTSLCPKSFVFVMTADGTPMPLVGVSSIVTQNISLLNVYHIAKLTMNLVSIGQLCVTGYLVLFSSSSCHVQDLQSQKLIGTCRRQRGLYVLDTLKAPDIAASSIDLSSFRLSSSSSSFYLWHSCLGHVLASRLSSFWGETVLTIVHLIKKIPSSNTSGYGDGKKGYRCFDLIAQKLYVSHYVVFLEHILFFSISDSSLNLTKSHLIHIDPFYDDEDSSSFKVPHAINTTPPRVSYSHVPITHFPLHYSCKVHPSFPVDTGTLVPDAPSLRTTT